MAIAVAALVLGVSPELTRGALALVVAGVVAAFAGVVWAAANLARFTAAQADAVRQDALWGTENVRELAGRIIQGEQPELPASPPVRDPADDAFDLLFRDLTGLNAAAEECLVRVAETSAGRGRQQGEVLAGLAWRMQGLLQRQIIALENLYGMIEQPRLLKVLYEVDHLAVQVRRACENLAVLSGASPRRQRGEPITVHDVLRSAIQEVELYSRVHLVSVEGDALRGAAAADVIHLIAELIENATKFSPPDTKVTVRTFMAPAGLAIEVEDLGLGMRHSDLQRVNALLADPEQADAGDRLRKGQIGAYVVSVLARQCGISVQLQANIYGGVTAVAVLPPSLLATTTANVDRPAEPSWFLRPATTPQAAPSPPTRAEVLPPAPPQPLPTRHPHHAQAEEPRLPDSRQPDDGRPRLPVRRPQENLAPELRGGPPGESPGQPPAPAGGETTFMAGFFTSRPGNSHDGHVPVDPYLKEKYGQR